MLKISSYTKLFTPSAMAVHQLAQAIKQRL